MERDELLKALFKLAEFCNNNRIEYIVTGSMALDLLGLRLHGYTPNDIDIKVSNLTIGQRNKLLELQFLTCSDSKGYSDSKCFTFKVNDVKVNAIVDDTEDIDKVYSQGVVIKLVDKETANHILVHIQFIEVAIAEKMKLGRDKDNRYMVDLIRSLSSLLHNK